MLLLLHIALQVCLCAGYTVSSIEESTNHRSTHVSTANICAESPDSVQGERHYACTGLLSPSSLPALVPATTTHLTVQHSNLTHLGGGHLVRLTSLRVLVVRNSLVVLSTLPWPPSLPLQQLTWQRCWSQASRDRAHFTVAPQIWSELKSLTNLSLLHNNIIVPEDGPASRGFALLPPACYLIVQDGGFQCQSSLISLLDLVTSGRASVSENTTCFTTEEIGRFNSFYTFNNKPLMEVLRVRKTMELCPSECSCELFGIRTFERPMMSVNCSGVGLTALPHTIPPLANTLMMTDNRLTSLDDLFSNSHFRHLAKCDFSSNAISSINGTALVQYLSSVQQDIRFNLRDNNLSTFPVWELSNFYNKAHRSGQSRLPAFDLSNNPWDCNNCSFSPYFKSFVYDNMYHIPDHMNIRCSKTGSLVLHMDFGVLCNPAPSGLLWLDVLNIFMALLLALMVLDFLYNYYQYRRNGRLPWIMRNCKVC